MKSLVENFPREIGFPKRMLVKDREEFYSLINKYNGIKTVFYSIYDCDEYRTYDKCTIDKLFFDFDGEYALEDMKRFHAYLNEKNIKHLMLFSGSKGFHMYVFTKPIKDTKNNKRDVVFNAQTYFIEKLGLRADEKVIGDIARFGRVPNTRHLTSNLFCIPISEEDLESGLYNIKEKSKQPQMEFILYEKELFDLGRFDRQSRRRQIDMPVFAEEMNVSGDKIIDRMPPCVRLWLEDPINYCKNDSRFFFALYCRDMAIPDNKVLELAEKYWSGVRESNGQRTKYREFIDEKALFYSKRSEKLVPSCNTLYHKNLCPGRCNRFKKDGFPIYK